MRRISPNLNAKLAAAGRNLTLLIVRLGAMGDIVRTVPALRHLREHLPEARFHWIVDPPWIPVLEGDRDLESCLRFPRKELEQARLRTLRTLRRELRGLDCDATLDFHGNLRSGMVARLSGAPARFGYAGHQQKEGNRWLSTHRLPSGDRRTPRIERNMALPELLGLPAAPSSPRLDGDLPIFERGAGEAAQILRERGSRRGSFAVVSPGASVRQAYKRPPTELLLSACRRAVEHGLQPLVVWGPGERPDAEAVCDLAGQPDWLAPATSLPALAALIREAALFVGGDSGPMHLACAAATPTLAIYGPTDPRVNGPWGTESEIVSVPDDRYTGVKRQDRELGFEGIDAERVGDAVRGLLRRVEAAKSAQ